MSAESSKKKFTKPSELLTRRDPALFDKFTEAEYLENRFERYLKEFTFSRKETALIRKAYDFSSLSHQNQLRDNAYPFFLHPLRVANIILHELKIPNTDMLCAGLLHDVIEHCSVTYKELKNNFPETVVNYVRVLTKPDSISARNSIYFENIRKAPAEIKTIKLCDRLDNCRAQRLFENKVKIRKYLCEMRLQYLPLAKEVSPYLSRELTIEQTVMQNRLKNLERKTK